MPCAKMMGNRCSSTDTWKHGANTSPDTPNHTIANMNHSYEFGASLHLPPTPQTPITRGLLRSDAPRVAMAHTNDENLNCTASTNVICSDVGKACSHTAIFGCGYMSALVAGKTFFFTRKGQRRTWESAKASHNGVFALEGWHNHSHTWRKCCNVSALGWSTDKSEPICVILY